MRRLIYGVPSAQIAAVQQRPPSRLRQVGRIAVRFVVIEVRQALLAVEWERKECEECEEGPRDSHGIAHLEFRAVYHWITRGVLCSRYGTNTAAVLSQRRGRNRGLFLARLFVTKAGSKRSHPDWFNWRGRSGTL